jgi:uncharacterized phage-associated protein
VYHTFKIYGKGLINDLAVEMVMDGKTYQFSVVTPRLSKNELLELSVEYYDRDKTISSNILDLIWRAFGKYGGAQLVDIARKQGSSWQTTFFRGDKLTAIPNEIIKQDFLAQGFRR